MYNKMYKRKEYSIKPPMYIVPDIFCYKARDVCLIIKYFLNKITVKFQKLEFP